MRCYCCNRLLSDYESTRKSKATGDYLDMCNKCFNTVSDDIESDEISLDELEEEELRADDNQWEDFDDRYEN